MITLEFEWEFSDMIGKRPETRAARENFDTFWGMWQEADNAERAGNDGSSTEVVVRDGRFTGIGHCRMRTLPACLGVEWW